MTTPKVSVIIPVYRVEKYVERCTDSLMRQTLDNIEYIFVDDASPDNSMDIIADVIKRYPHRALQVRVIHHDLNQGLPAARNTGLAKASGEYVFHCDSDDYVEPDMLEQLYIQATQNNADIVWCDWFLTFEHNERYMKQPSFSNALDALKSMLGGGMKYNVWNKLVRRNIYTDNNIQFPSGYGMGEDMTMMLLFAHAQRVAYLNSAFYHYVKQNTEAFSSSTVSGKHYSALKHNVDYICTELSKIYPTELNEEMAFLKLESKYPLLVVCGNWNTYRQWNEWYPEANKYISKNKNISFRSRLIQQCANYKQYWLVWLHYQLVCRLIYGVIYR